MEVEGALYNALMAKNFKEVSRRCRGHPEKALQTITIYNDTPLHMAAQCPEGKDLLLELLKMLPAPADNNSQLSGLKNSDGNTVLHEVATSDAMKDAAEELLKRDPDLITQTNELGEKPIFCAARYGQIEMFEFLADKMELENLTTEEIKTHLQRNGGKTVLHSSIVAECFKLSKLIAERYPFLIKERDESSMTALQYLACNPTPFQKGKAQIKRGFIEFLMESNVRTKPRLLERKLQLSMKEIFPELYEIFNPELVQRESCVQELVQHLVKNDTSWNTDSEVVGSNNSRETQTNMATEEEAQYLQESLKSDESPLFLATMSNIEVIVEEILKLKPNALKHTNKDGMNLLHVAILYGRTDIFDMVIGKFEVLARRLLLAKDNKGNSVLHMVSLNRKGLASDGKMHSPALQLRDEVLLFEKVKAASKMVLSNPLNNDNKTAEELFGAKNDQLHKEANKWIMSTTQNCTILSVFIATVAFAAAYTVPGGPDQDTGYPMFRSKPFFKVFILADMTAITLALISLGIFLSILTSSFPLEDFKRYVFAKLVRGIICLILSVSAMAVAFGATIALVTARNGVKVVWDAVAFLPVPIFILSFSPLHSLFPEPCIKLLKTLAVVCLFLIVYISAVFILDPILSILLVISFPLVILVPTGICGIVKGMLSDGDFISKVRVLISKLIRNQPQSPHTTSDTELPQV